MTDDSAYLTDAFHRFITATVTPTRVRETERTLSHEPLWGELAASGFLDALVGEDLGGAGLSLRQTFPLLMTLGENAVPLPFAETMFARALVARHGERIPDGATVVIAAGSSVTPFAMFASHALVERDDRIDLVEARGRGSDVFGTGSALQFDYEATITSFAAQRGTLLLAAAAITSAQMAGSMARVLEMTLRYASERQQFGRPLGKFQAIQQQLAILAGQVVSSQIAARIAFTGKNFEAARVAVAKCRANEAATHACTISHAVHGAIGATAEFDLQLHTRRLKQWQLAFGSESYWAARLGGARAVASCDTTADFIRGAFADQTAADGLGLEG